MRILAPASRDELILAWLRSEWGGLRPAHPDRRLIDDPDLADIAQNAARTALLFRDRGIILQELPYEMRPEWVSIEEADLPGLYIIPCREWYLDTGRTFRVTDTAANLKSGRHPVDHMPKIDAITRSLAGDDAAMTDGALILIATDHAGPYTIIDGTHRAAALYRTHLAVPNMPWKGILVAERAIEQSLWHIESPGARRNLNACAWAAALGMLR